MRFAMFYHSLVSDWNHGNAHFLRGVVTELLARGHAVNIYEPRDGWSRRNLIDAHGPEAVAGFHRAYPRLQSTLYDSAQLDLPEALDDADVVIAHEWNEPALIARLGEYHRGRKDMCLLFHDTHHRAVSDPASMARYDLHDYDGVLAFGRVVRDLYLRRRWARQAWIWHEAADVRVFRPMPAESREGDVVWIGNWGDGERSDTLREFLIEPIRQLGLTAEVYGVRYPDRARRLLREANIKYRGWLANYDVPRAFARFKVTLHIPRRPYVEKLPGIPTIRPFEAMAAGIPLICSPWHDREHLFEPGKDYLVARDGEEMAAELRRLLATPEERAALAAHARKTILDRHTCGHRVEALLEIVEEVRNGKSEAQNAKYETNTKAKNANVLNSR